MTVEITPGPVPADGTRINIETAMTAFVSGTDITGFGPDEFLDSPVNFMVSSTDPPATDSRTKATLWFKRGEGRLYRWIAEPVRSADFAPSEEGNNTSEAHWIAISDRRELIVLSKWGVKEGELLNGTRGASDWKVETSIDYGSRPRYTYVVSATANSGGSDGQGVGFSEQIMLSMAAAWDPVFVALEDAAHVDPGTYTKVVEFGFCKALISGPARDGGEPMPFWWMSDKDPHYVGYTTNYTSWTNTAAVVGFVGESAASSAEARQLTVFLKPELTNNVRPDGFNFLL